MICVLTVTLIMAGFMIARIISGRIQQKRARDELKPGGSLLNTTIEEISHHITSNTNISIQISNYSHRYILTNPRVFTSSGHAHQPPQPTVQRRRLEACTFTGGAAGGAVGVLLYQIQTHRRGRRAGHLAIMFSVSGSSENVFSVGVFEEQVLSAEQVFRLMCYSVGPFIRAQSTGTEISYSGRNTCVRATMSPAARSIMYVELWDM